MTSRLENDPWATADGFLDERADFLEVVVTPGRYDDGGFDVVLRIDGTYYGDRATAVEVAEMCRTRILRLLGPAAAAKAGFLRSVRSGVVR